MSDYPSFPMPATTLPASNLCHLFVLPDSVILILRVKEKNVAAHEYAPPHTGVSITRASSGNGALPTRELEQGEDNETKSRHAVKRDG
jgi:hypothetical protein